MPKAKFSDVHLHVSGRQEVFDGGVELTIHVLTPQVPDPKRPTVAAQQQFAGYASLGRVKIQVDAATSQGIVPGAKFNFNPVTPTP